MVKDQGLGIRDRRAIAAILTVIIVSIFLLSVGILSATRSNTSIFSGKFSAQADRAQALAEAGIQDALIKVARNASYTATYTLTETDGTVEINVADGTPIRITATSTVTQGGDTIKRTMRADVTIDANGKITNVSKTNL